MLLKVRTKLYLQITERRVLLGEVSDVRFLDPPSPVSPAWRWYVLYFCEIKMQQELPKLGLRKTKIKVRSCSSSLEMFNLRRLSLKNGWVSDVFPLDYIQVFSSKLTSDSSILLKESGVALFCLRSSRKCCRRLPPSRDGGGVAGMLITSMH